MNVMLAGSRRSTGRRRGWVAAVVLAIVLAPGCGPDEADGGPDEEVAVAEPAPAPIPEELAPPLRPFLPDLMRRSTRAETFPHPAHVEIACSVCHESVRGHVSHSELPCADCHRASALGRLSAVGPDECLACHHGVEQTFECERCHDPPGALRTVQSWHLAVWTSPRPRDLGFDHSVHAAVECEAGHSGAPDLAPEPCASCHGDHHTEAARCGACHVPPAEGIHGPEVHRTCAGAGCHTEPAIESIAHKRPVCLVCHQEQVEHEPEGECVECHRVGGASLSVAEHVPRGPLSGRARP